MASAYAKRPLNLHSTPPQAVLNAPPACANHIPDAIYNTSVCLKKPPAPAYSSSSVALLPEDPKADVVDSIQTHQRDTMRPLSSRYTYRRSPVTAMFRPVTPLPFSVRGKWTSVASPRKATHQLNVLWAITRRRARDRKQKA